MKKLLFLILLFTPFLVSAVQQHEKHWEVVQCWQDASIAVAVTLTGLGSTNFTAAEVQQSSRMLIQTEGDAIRWTQDGTTPTSTVGFIQTETDPPFFYSGELETLKFIEESTSTVVQVCLYK